MEGPEEAQVDRQDDLTTIVTRKGTEEDPQDANLAGEAALQATTEEVTEMEEILHRIPQTAREISPRTSYERLQKPLQTEIRAGAA